MIIQVGRAIGICRRSRCCSTASSAHAAALTGTDGLAALQRGDSLPAAPGQGGLRRRAIIFGGALLLTPGFITDIVGLPLLIPPTRAGCAASCSAVRRRRSARPGRLFFLYDRTPGARPARRRARRGSRRPPPPGGSRDYDFDGSAREIPETARTSSTAAASARAVRLLSFIAGEHGYCSLSRRRRRQGSCRLGDGDASRPRRRRPERGPGRLDPSAATVESRGARPGRRWSSRSARRRSSLRGRRQRAATAAGSLVGPGVAWELPENGCAGAADGLGDHREERPARCSSRCGPRTPASTARSSSAPPGSSPSAEPYAYAEPLLSTEYDGDGPTRGRRWSSGPAATARPSAAAACGSRGGASTRDRPARGGALRLEPRRHGGRRRLRDPDADRARPRRAFGTIRRRADPRRHLRLRRRPHLAAARRLRRASRTTPGSTLEQLGVAITAGPTSSTGAPAVRARVRPDHRGPLPRRAPRRPRADLGQRPPLHRFKEIFFEA